MNRKVERAKRTWLGRVFCRLLGDRNGGVMMEYVIIGVMVAAASVATIYYFGGTIREAWEKMTKVVQGDPTGAAEIAQTSGEVDAALDDARKTGKKTVTGE